MVILIIHAIVKDAATSREFNSLWFRQINDHPSDYATIAVKKRLVERREISLKTKGRIYEALVRTILL